MAPAWKVSAWMALPHKEGGRALNLFGADSDACFAALRKALGFLMHLYLMLPIAKATDS